MEVSEFEQRLFEVYRSLSGDDWTMIWCVLSAWFFMGMIGWGIGHGRGRGPFGFLMGSLLGPIGWFITICLPPQGRKCHLCLGIVPDGAMRCRHCGAELSTFPSLRGA